MPPPVGNSQLKSMTVSYDTTSGNLILNMPDGSKQGPFMVMGQPGIGLSSVNYDPKIGNLTLNMTDGSKQGPFMIMGPQGPQGITGAIGIQGIAGAIGQQGLQGITGAIGLSGQQGPIGLSGSIGQQGPIGLSGSIGQQGPIGLSGQQGPIGLSGSIGQQGPIGLSGQQGSIGLSGQQGPIGLSGPIGPIGATGVSGAMGPLSDAPLYFRYPSDTAHGVVYNRTLDGPRLYGNGGGALGYSGEQGSNSLSWNNSGLVNIPGNLCIGPADNNWCFTPNADKQRLDIRRNGAIGDKLDTGEFHLTSDGNIYIQRSIQPGFIAENIARQSQAQQNTTNVVPLAKLGAVELNPEQIAIIRKVLDSRNKVDIYRLIYEMSRSGQVQTVDRIIAETKSKDNELFNILMEGKMRAQQQNQQQNQQQVQIAQQQAAQQVQQQVQIVQQNTKDVGSLVKPGIVELNSEQITIIRKVLDSRNKVDIYRLIYEMSRSGQVQTVDRIIAETQSKDNELFNILMEGKMRAQQQMQQQQTQQQQTQQDRDRIQSNGTSIFRPIQTNRGNRCIDVPGGTKENSYLQTYDCNNTDAQNWSYNPNDKTFVSKISNKCMDVNNGDAKEGTVVQQWDCNGGKGQQWGTDSNNRIISALDSNLCLNVKGGIGNNGDRLQLGKCSDDHKFVFI